jgi:hypothetical protein
VTGAAAARFFFFVGGAAKPITAIRRTRAQAKGLLHKTRVFLPDVE